MDSAALRGKLPRPCELIRKRRRYETGVIGRLFFFTLLSCPWSMLQASPPAPALPAAIRLVSDRRHFNENVELCFQFADEQWAARPCSGGGPLLRNLRPASGAWLGELYSRLRARWYAVRFFADGAGWRLRVFEEYGFYDLQADTIEAPGNGN
ncbi:MAG: hypothetical protein K1X75_02500 [Leptospirales bacterium]|nr:hypothetical protein [Leptospirales bacterium]